MASRSGRLLVWLVGRALALLVACSFGVEAAAAPPGTLVSSDPVVDTPAGAQAWRIRYWTTSDRGQPIEVTGMVVAPREAMPARPRDVVAWTHGTSGVVERCAPSNSPQFFAATPGLTEAMKRGYVVVAPDYPGLGSGTAHAYLGGVSAANATLDAVRAARGIAGAAAGKRFVVWGESQGGHAALWTGQRARAYAPDLNLLGVAAAAPPTDLVENLRGGGDPSVRAFLTAFTAYSWSQHYGAPLASLGNRQTQGIITRLAQNNCIELGKKPKLGAVLGVMALRSSLKNVDLGSIRPWSDIARTNSVPARNPGVPVLITQNPGDKIVSPAVTRAYVAKMCRSGARLRFESVTGLGHETSGRDATALTMQWIANRFASAPGPSNCPMA